MALDLQQIAYRPSTGVRRVFETPIRAATAASLEGYGCLVDDPKSLQVGIGAMAGAGWRPIDANSGDQGGVTEGLFEFWWLGRDALRSQQRRG